jgi:hypothetical protein
MVAMKSITNGSTALSIVRKYLGGVRLADRQDAFAGALVRERLIRDADREPPVSCRDNALI